MKPEPFDVLDQPRARHAQPAHTELARTELARTELER